MVTEVIVSNHGPQVVAFISHRWGRKARSLTWFFSCQVPLPLMVRSDRLLAGPVLG